MNNKTSDKNVATEDDVMSQEAFNELIDNFEVVATLTMYGRKSIKYYVKKMQAEREQDKKRIQELEEENAELLELKISVSSMNTIQNLEKEKIKLEERCFIAEGNLKTTKKELRDYFYNSIPKQTVIDKIEELKKQISIDICIENNLEKHYELKYKIEVLQELLEGEK